jgi:hypothetical protein
VIYQLTRFAGSKPAVERFQTARSGTRIELSKTKIHLKTKPESLCRDSEAELLFRGLALLRTEHIFSKSV